MESNEILREQFSEVVDNQLKANDPPETIATYNRLVAEGFSDIEAREMICQCVSIAIFDVMNNEEPFNLVRYCENLNKLPEDPFDE